ANDPKPTFSPSPGNSEIRGIGFGRPSCLAALLSFVVPLHFGPLTVDLRFWRLSDGVGNVDRALDHAEMQPFKHAPVYYDHSLFAFSGWRKAAMISRDQSTSSCVGEKSSCRERSGSDGSAFFRSCRASGRARTPHAGPPRPGSRYTRINALETPWGTEVLIAACDAVPDAILVAKIVHAGDVISVAKMLQVMRAA